MEAIEEWIATEKESSREYAMELKNKEEELKAKFKLEVVMVKLEISVKKLELYTEMLSETAQQEVKLWGENPTVEWINHMRQRWWEQQGAEMDKKLIEAYEKEAKSMQQSLEDITGTLGWSTVGTDEDLQTSGLSPDVSPDQGQ